MSVVRLLLVLGIALPGGLVGEVTGAQPPPAGQPLAQVSAVAAGTDDRAIDYLRDIRPILSGNCYACHGPDEASREADLRLDRLPSVMRESGSGTTPIVPGHPEKSEIIRRISSDDEDAVMPPLDSGKSLTPEQIELVRRWIQQGAPWKEHWSFAPCRRPELPGVSHRDWPRNAIDYFILAALDEKSWAPAPEAEKALLIRRVTFDLTGLPPTLAEVDAFLADDSPDAYERLVDRLLQSPRYGEHMARFWLDKARYADTHGLHLDNFRQMWLYRDWVVRAFNENLPYDQFTIEQLAGDLLPNPTIDQQIATGFCRCNVTTNEGGSIEEEVFVRNVVDRVSTTGEVFLGLTVGCAVCHDHKFDPLSQREFYQLFAFFNSLDGPAMDGNVEDPAPVVRVPDKEQIARLEGLRERIEKIRSKRNERMLEDDASFTEWLAERQKLSDSGQADPELNMDDGLAVHCKFETIDGDRVASAAGSEQHGQIVGKPSRIESPTGHGLELGAGDYIDLGDAGDLGDEKPFAYGAWVKVGEGLRGTILARMDVGDLNKGYDLSVDNGVVTTEINKNSPGNCLKVATQKQVLTPGKWHHVFVTYNGSKMASGVAVYVDGKPQSTDTLADSLKYKSGIHVPKPLLLGRRDHTNEFAGGCIDDARVYARRLSDADVQAIYAGSDLTRIVKTPREQWSESELRLARQFYFSQNDRDFIELTSQIEKISDELQIEESKVPSTLVFREAKQKRDAFVLLRGQYDLHGDPVERRTPEFLPPMDVTLPKDRLGLARWMVAPENPLTSRVAVNHFWQQVFGFGLVKTSEDFGSQGAPPSHPALLDWLAVEFRESGWDVKSLMKMLVTSATYRQSCHASPALMAQDPENRFLARGPRFRLDAEMLRDQALAVSGLLVEQMGGPSVKPPQPDGLWKAVGYTDSNTVNFVADTGNDKVHRRTLYTFVKRTAPPPQLSTFDAPSRESFCVRRERTNTPLQALLLMNDPQYFEAARALAGRVAEADGITPAARAAYLYRLCTARYATDETTSELVGLYESQLQRLSRDETAVKNLLGTEPQLASADLEADELAAWTIVANLILNMDEVLTKN
ncbi:MAG: DUF1553 domain-containing protein [Pirellulales bacterium]